ncbi:DEAD/DEAH box helicase [Litorivicinus lipolyticus]|uniref:DEAD/DEAH box helicase n=1 Tax=Litorivicinus lipolyticus TaxID=418701 RepID=UPI003B5BEA09
MQFDQLGLAQPILDAVLETGYTTPTPIQAQSIPAVMSGRDVMAAAQTGTGKTAGFTLPILDRLSKGERARPNQARALIITPTRELAAQILDNVQTYAKHLPIKAAVVFGGVKINPQMQKLRGGVDVLVATPGRLLDLHQQNAIKFEQLEVLVLDEADRMLDMGFIHDIKRIFRLLPPKRQNLLYSATFSQEIRNLAKGLVNDPVEISVTPRNSTVERIEQRIYPTDKADKTTMLIRLIKDNNWHQVLVFSRTKHGANKIATLLGKADIPSAAIHGNKSQGARTRALAEFKSGDLQVLVATDIAARGIDIDELPYVVNYDLPNVSEDYVHRIGRTGRAGKSGLASSLVDREEFPLLQDIERLIQKILPRHEIEGFTPSTPLPESSLRGPRSAPRPKKPKPTGDRRRDDSRGGNRDDNRGNSRGNSRPGGGRSSTRSDNSRGESRGNGGERASSGQRRDGDKPANSRRRSSAPRRPSAPSGNR